MSTDFRGRGRATSGAPKAGGPRGRPAGRSAGWRSLSGSHQPCPPHAAAGRADGEAAVPGPGLAAGRSAEAPCLASCLAPGAAGGLAEGRGPRQVGALSVCPPGARTCFSTEGLGSDAGWPLGHARCRGRAQPAVTCRFPGGSPPAVVSEPGPPARGALSQAVPRAGRGRVRAPRPRASCRPPLGFPGPCSAGGTEAPTPPGTGAPQQCTCPAPIWEGHGGGDTGRVGTQANRGVTVSVGERMNRSLARHGPR